MNKKETIELLAEFLTDWPTSTAAAPVVDSDWYWELNVKDRAIYCVRKNDFAHIGKAEWEAEIDKSVKCSVPVVKIPVEAMIDIETLDTTNDAIVFQAAIVMFDEDHNITYQETWNLDVDEQFISFRSMSASTLAFHLQIPTNAKAALEDKDATTMAHFASDLCTRFDVNSPKKIWAKGSFDFNILENLFRLTDSEVPWKFYQLRELRTLMDETGVPRGDVAHTALDDCIAQVAQLAECRAVIKSGVAMAEAMAESGQSAGAKLGGIAGCNGPNCNHTVGGDEPHSAACIIQHEHVFKGINIEATPSGDAMRALQAEASCQEPKSKLSEGVEAMVDAEAIAKPFVPTGATHQANGTYYKCFEYMWHYFRPHSHTWVPSSCSAKWHAEYLSDLNTPQKPSDDEISGD